MRHLILTVLFLSCTACGKNRHIPTIEPSAAPYVEHFEQQFQAQYGVTDYHITTDVSVGDTGEDPNEVIAVCYYDGGEDEPNEIVLDPTWWNTKLSPEGREQVMLHELGHCELNRDHDDTFVDNGLGAKVKRSIMSTFKLWDSNYLDYRDRYQHELFHPGQF